MRFQYSVDRLAPDTGEQGGAQNGSEGKLDVGGAADHVCRVALVCATAGLFHSVRHTQDGAIDGAVTCNGLYTSLRVKAQEAGNSRET